MQISKENSEKVLIEILKHSEFLFKNHWNQRSFPNLFNLRIRLTPAIYTKHYNKLGRYQQILNERLNNSSGLMVDKIEILPDYDKLELVNSEIIPVQTKWQEINKYQQRLIENFERSRDSIDFQNLGNTARTIMDKLARKVFDPEKHKPNDPEIKVNNGNFKNQLHTFIDVKLSGSKNKELKKLAESAINFVENAINLMNSTTHKLNAKVHLAEVSVICTISAVSIIKLINELE
ncbi:hypothetical protein ES705_15851 [subsurface metagenome]